MTTIEIYRDGVWAGTGTIDKGGEIECTAVLGGTQDESDEAYLAIMDALDADPQDEDRYTGTGTVSRPDGEYSWIVKEG